MIYIKDFEAVLKVLKRHIHDDYRAIELDDLPGIQVTFATNKSLSDWTYQTGDNSYTGSCYSYPYWAVVYLYRRSNCRELAKEAINELEEQIASDAYSRYQDMLP